MFTPVTNFVLFKRCPSTLSETHFTAKHLGCGRSPQRKQFYAWFLAPCTRYIPWW